MATKEQERKALARIRKIVAELGEDSYLATAFDGAWELAEENIENDFGNSTRWYIDKYNNSGEDVRKAREEAEEDSRKLRVELEEMKADLEHWQGKFTKKSEEYVTLLRSHNELWNKYREAQKAEKEVIRLKAMLFDLMFDKK